MKRSILTAALATGILGTVFSSFILAIMVWGTGGWMNGSTAGAIGLVAIFVALAVASIWRLSRDDPESHDGSA